MKAMWLWDEMRADMRRHGTPLMKALAVIFGGMAAFLVTLFDAVFLRFGDDLGVRSALVFLASWLLGSFMFYGWMVDLKVRWSRLRDPNFKPKTLTNKQAAILLVGLAILGLLWLLFGDLTLISFG